VFFSDCQTNLLQPKLVVIYLVACTETYPIGRVAGILTCLGGVLLAAAVSWYANNVQIQHEIDTRSKLMHRYIFGAVLFVGWIDSSLLVLTGLFGICAGCGGGDTYEDGHRSYCTDHRNQLAVVVKRTCKKNMTGILSIVFIEGGANMPSRGPPRCGIS